MMKLSKLHTLLAATVACTLLMVVSVLAQTPDLLKPVESLIDRNTFLAVHVDVKQLDVEKAGESLKKVMNSAIEALKANDDFLLMAEQQGSDVDEMSQEFQGQLDANIPKAKEFLAKIASFGVTDLYVVSSSRIMMTVPAQIVIVGDSSKFAQLKSELKLEEEPVSNQVYITEKDNLLIICPVLPTAMKDGVVDGEAIEKELAKIKPAMRTELVEAIEKSDDGAIRVIFAPDGAIKGMLSLALASAPEPFNTINAKTITDGAKWVSLIADPMNFKASLTVQSVSEEAAKDLHNLMLELAQIQLKVLEDMGMPEEMIKAAKEQQERAQKYMLQVSGDQLVVKIDEKYMVGYVNDVLLPNVMSLLPLLTNLGGM